MDQRRLTTGTRHRVKSSVVVLEGAVDLGRVLVRNEATGEQFECAVGELEPLAGDVVPQSSRPELSPKEQRRLVKIFQVLKPLADRKDRRLQAVRAAALRCG